MEQLQALLIRDALIASLFLLAIASQWTFYKRTGSPFLRMGAVALVFGLVAEIFRSLTAVNLPGAGLIANVAMIGFGLFIYAVLRNIAGEKVSLPVIGVAVGLMLSSVVALEWLTLPESLVAPVSVIWQLPALLLLTHGVFRIMRSDNLTPGRLFLVLSVGLYGVFAVTGPFLAGLPIAIILDTYLHAVILLLIGGVLPLIAAERMIANLREKEAQLGYVEQEKKRLEVQFSQAQKHESLGVLAGGIAHDFNNMLTSILGYTQLAMNKLSPDSDARKDLYMAMSGARQAVELTSQMLVYAGKGAVEFKSVNLSAVVEDMANLVNSVVPNKVQLVFNMAADLPLVKCDPVQMGQVVMNLVANGVDAIRQDTGMIEVTTGVNDVSSEEMSRCWFAEEHEPGAFVYLRVTDTGMGIDQSQVDRIFDPFYSEKSQGKGLGLASLSGIVRQHKGFIAVESARGRGTTFTLYFPAIAFKDSESQSSIDIFATPVARKQRVLIADDDPRIRSLIVSILESDGYEVVDVEDGREATNIAKTEPFDVLMLDCTMPKRSGVEVYRDVRAQGDFTPVVLISGFQQEQVLTDVSADEQAHFMKKPFNVDELLEVVRRFATQQKSLSEFD